MRRCKAGQRARSTLLWGLLLFMGIQLGVAVAVICRPELHDPAYGIRLVRLARRRPAATRPPLIVALGTSRTQLGMKAAVLEERLALACGQPVAVLNLGQPGMSLVTELLTTNRLLADGIRPKLLVIEVLPMCLSAGWSSWNTMDAARMPSERLWWCDLPLVQRYGGPARADVGRTWLWSWLVPIFSHRVDLLYNLAPFLLSLEERMTLASSVADADTLAARVIPDRSQALKHARAEYLDDLRRFRLGGLDCQALRELLNLCRQEHLAAALLVMPEGPEFRSWYPPAVWQQIQTFLNGLSREYDVPLIDCRAWMAEGDFADSHHLLPAAADQFSRRLACEKVLQSAVWNEPSAISP